MNYIYYLIILIYIYIYIYLYINQYSTRVKTSRNLTHFCTMFNFINRKFIRKPKVCKCFKKVWKHWAKMSKTLTQFRVSYKNIKR